MERPEREVLLACDQVVAKLRGLMSEDRDLVRDRFRQALWKTDEGASMVRFILDLIHPDRQERRAEAAERMLSDKSRGHFSRHLLEAVIYADRANLERLAMAFPEITDQYLPALTVIDSLTPGVER